MRCRTDREKFHFHQLSQRRVERLLNDKKNFQQNVHGDIRALAHEGQDLMMNASETPTFENLIGLDGKGATSKK
jgi:hypothetical protein